MRRSNLATSRRGMMLGRVGMKGGRGGERRRREENGAAKSYRGGARDV